MVSPTVALLAHHRTQTSESFYTHNFLFFSIRRVIRYRIIACACASRTEWNKSVVEKLRQRQGKKSLSSNRHALSYTVQYTKGI